MFPWRNHHCSCPRLGRKRNACCSHGRRNQVYRALQGVITPPAAGPALPQPGEMGTFSGTAQNILAHPEKCQRTGKLSERAATERIFLIRLYNCGTTSADFPFQSDAAPSNSRPKNKFEESKSYAAQQHNNSKKVWSDMLACRAAPF